MIPLLLLSTSVLQGAQVPSAAPRIRFTDRTAESGLFHQHACTDVFAGMCEMTGGVTVGDFDDDGWPDLFVLAGSGGGPDKLYLNQRDGTFLDRAAAWGVDRVHIGVGATAGDVDGDGLMDLFVTSLGPGPVPVADAHLLYRNVGGAFVEVAEQSGVRATSGTHADGFGAAFGDYDLDGDLDLFVAGWHGWAAAPSLGNRLFQNDGTGVFADVTGLAIDVPSNTNGFSPTFADMDGDRYPELLLAGDFGTSRYFVNQRDGTFVESTSGSGLGLDGNGMGSAVADLDGDGDLDWLVTSISRYTSPTVPGTGNMLYVNLGAHVFREASAAAGVKDGFWGWGVVAADFDHDGDQDLAEVNGFEEGGMGAFPSRLWRNEGTLEFTQLSRQSGFHVRASQRGLVTLDYDGDGDLDLVSLENGDTDRPPATNGGHLRLHSNELPSGPGCAWLAVRLDTDARADLAPDGFGARVVVTAGGRTVTRYVSGGTSYLGRSSLNTHFGLGDAAIAERIEVHWSDGTVTVLNAQPCRRRLTIAAP